MRSPETRCYNRCKSLHFYMGRAGLAFAIRSAQSMLNL